MSVNRHKPHLFVLPEDDANREIANGFRLAIAVVSAIYVADVANGWMKVLKLFEDVFVKEMRRYPKRVMVLLIDFDGAGDARLEYAKERIPLDLVDRVFVLGSMLEPQDLRKDLGVSFESLGRALAKDCREDSNLTWHHPMLVHNLGELTRLREQVRDILF